MVNGLEGRRENLVTTERRRRLEVVSLSETLDHVQMHQSGSPTSRGPAEIFWPEEFSGSLVAVVTRYCDLEW